MKTESEAYRYTPLIFRALNMRASALANMPFRLVRNGVELKWDDVFRTPLKTLLKLTEASILLSGSAYWLAIDQGTRRLGAQWLNPYTVKKTVEQSTTAMGVRTRVTYHQSTGGMNLGPWDPDQVTHFQLFNPRDDMIEGVAPVSVSMQASRMMYFMRNFTVRFFENGGMPVTVVSFDGDLNQEQVKQMETMYRRAAAGTGNAFNVVAIPGKITATPVMPELKTLAMADLRQQALDDICHAFGIPQTMMTDAANYATAVEYRQSFYEETVNPEADWIAEIINAQFLAPTGLRLEACPERMDIFQVSEAKRATSVGQLTGSGLDLLTSLEVLGFDLTAEQWERVRLAKKTPRKSLKTPAGGKVSGKPAGGGGR